MVIVSTSPSSPQLFNIFNPKKHHHSHKHQASSIFISSHLSSNSLLYSKRCKLYHNPPNIVISPSKCKHSSRIYAISENLQLAEVTPVENSEQIVTTSAASAASGDGVSNIISVLLFIAFVGLSVLTIGVIYIAVTDYLQKREREKFEKEESAKKKKSNKKRKVKARAGPKGFGQKIVEVDEDDDS